MTPQPPPDKLYDLVRIMWRIFRSLTAELDKWAKRHYGQGLKQDEGQDSEKD